MLEKWEKNWLTGTDRGGHQMSDRKRRGAEAPKLAEVDESDAF